MRLFWLTILGVAITLVNTSKLIASEKEPAEEARTHADVDYTDSPIKPGESSESGTTAVDEAALSFAFTLNAPGEKVLVNEARLHVDCQGEGSVTVLFEAGLGGSSLEFKPVQERVAKNARACIYDRAGYAWSDPSPHPRLARTLAYDADTLLRKIGAEGPLILVGHSFGGFIARELALLRGDDVVGLILVDASHEDQLLRLEAINGRNMMPRGGSFYISPASVPESLPRELRQKIAAFSRMRKSYAALHSEMRYFRESAHQVKLDRRLMDLDLIVISRGLDMYGQDEQGRKKTAIWRELQADLATLSSRSRLLVAEGSGHHVHTDDPDLVVDSINSILDSVQD